MAGLSATFFFPPYWYSSSLSSALASSSSSFSTALSSSFLGFCSYNSVMAPRWPWPQTNEVHPKNGHYNALCLKNSHICSCNNYIISAPIHIILEIIHWKTTAIKRSSFFLTKTISCALHNHLVCLAFQYKQIRLMFINTSRTSSAFGLNTGPTPNCVIIY